MFWRRSEEVEAAAPLPNSRPNDPQTIPPPAPEVQEGIDERQQKLLEGEERRAEEGEPPDYTH
jgi:hypothetical protein